jgi:hypothetical protein
MLSINQCSEVLNKSEKLYNDAEVKQIRDFLYKIGELGYELFKGTNVTIQRWSELSEDLDVAWGIIMKKRSSGIEIVCTKQPLNTRGCYAKLILSLYLKVPDSMERS